MVYGVCSRVLDLGIEVWVCSPFRSASAKPSFVAPADGKVDMRLHGTEDSKLPWRKAGQPKHLVDVVDSDQ